VIGVEFKANLRQPQIESSLHPIPSPAEKVREKAKSLNVYVEQFEPEQAVRFPMVDYREQEWLVNVPF